MTQPNSASVSPPLTSGTPNLLEQYKLYVEMADRISARRATTNTFYVSLLTGLLAVLAIVVEKNILTNVQYVVFFTIALLGLTLCCVWFMNILSYRQLNTGKYMVIHEMEQQLPFACYDREWEVLGKGADWKKYLPLTHIEQYVPVFVAIPYVFLFAYSLYLMA